MSSLNRARGTAYDTSQTSNVYAANMATARTLNAAWATNVRLSYLWDPNKTPVLSRWETMLGLPVYATDTEADRRARLATVMGRIGRTVTEQSLATQLQSALGSAFVGVEYIAIANANIHVPDGTYPFGTASTTNPWYSTVAHVLIRTVVPTGWAESDFQNAVAKVGPIMDAQAPAWVTWDWYRPGPTTVSVSGGPSGGGFYLNDSHNFDNEVFDA